jgi:hypothetical protein
MKVSENYTVQRPNLVHHEEPLEASASHFQFHRNLKINLSLKFGYRFPNVTLLRGFWSANERPQLVGEATNICD